MGRKRAYEMLFKKMRATLREAVAGPLNLYTEYLDVGRFPEERFVRARFELINRQYAHLKIDLLVLVGPAILVPVSQYGGPFFRGIPTIYAELETDPRDMPELFRCRLRAIPSRLWVYIT